MILAYSNLDSSGFVALLSKETKEVLLETTFPQTPRGQNDVLRGITEILAKAQKTPADISGIALHIGPGKFTPARTACIIANTFAEELSIPLFPLLADEETTPQSFLDILISNPPPTTYFVEPIFLGTPNIGKKAKDPFSFSSDSTKIET